jgi:hypothetical protein
MGDGSIEVLQEPIYLQFKSVEQGGFLYENEEVLAQRHFTFHGNTQDIGEAVPTNPMDRVAVFDTDEAAQELAWDAATKQEVEARLERYAAEDPSSFLIVTSTPMVAPFPNYATFDGDATALVVKLIEDGHDVEDVLRYETVFGPKRPEVIEALEQAVEVKREQVVHA